MKGLDAVIARMRPLDDTDMLRVMQAVDMKAREQVVVTFNAARDPITGTPWKPTSAFTLSLRPSGGGRTLNATGGAGLLGSIIGRAPQVTADSVIIGTNKIYGSVIQEGKDTVPRNAKMLTIPNTKEAARAGSPRRFGRPLFFKQFKSGAKALVEALPNKGGLKVQYWGKDLVKGERRRFMGVSRSGPNYAGQLEATALGMIKKIIDGRAGSAAGGA